MMSQHNHTVFSIHDEGRRTIANDTSNLINNLKSLQGKVVSVSWVTKRGKRRLKFVEVDRIEGTLRNPLMSGKEITENDFNE